VFVATVNGDQPTGIAAENAATKAGGGHYET